ncbi:hypothetical protein [Streptomyces sp. NRRL F-5126]|nr:hypothetical protein [Streptomyces sp. NRRL F-5126]
MNAREQPEQCQCQLSGQAGVIRVVSFHSMLWSVGHLGGICTT